MARYVIPHYKGRLQRPYESHEWAKQMRDKIFTDAFGVIGAEVSAFQAEHDPPGGGRRRC